MLHRLRAAIAATCLFFPTTAAASGAVLPTGSDPEPTSVAVRMAIAPTPSATTRWTDITIPSGAAVGWLVPVRPGAAVDWAPVEWLASLDLATAPRVLPPYAMMPWQCPASRLPYDVPPPWTWTFAPLAAGPFTFATNVDDAELWASTHGFRLSDAQRGQVAALYGSGWKLVAIELPPSTTVRTSATLRVTDDADAVLPLVLTGQPEKVTKLTVFVIGAGAAEVENMEDLDPLKVLWGSAGSSYASVRDYALAKSTTERWLRESSSRGSFFHDGSVAQESFPGVVTSYFDDPDCVAAVRAAGSSKSPVDPATLSCGERTDLGRALAGVAPASAVITRLAGVIPRAQFGTQLKVDIAPGPMHPVVMRAGAYTPCGATTPPLSPPSRPPSTDDDPSDDPLTAPKSPRSPGIQPPPEPSPAPQQWRTAPSDGCGGDTVVVVDDYPSDDYDDSSDSCSSDTSSSSDSSGWDSSDSSDGCSSDSSDGWDSGDSSSSSDACSSDSSDGWDSSDSSSSCSTVKKRRGPSRLSRYVLLAVALLLPLRRRLRPASGDRS